MQWHELRNKLKQITDDNGVYDAYDYLLMVNNAHGVNRCRGNVGVDNAGVPTLTFCNRLSCWKCGVLVVNNHKQHAVNGAERLFNNGVDVWSMTAQPSDGDNTDYNKRLSAFLKTFSNNIVRDGRKLRYACYTGIKPSNGLLHSHFILSAMPVDAIHTPTTEYPHRYTSEWLTKTAYNYQLENFAVLLPTITDVIDMAQYSADNLMSVVGSNGNDIDGNCVRYSQRSSAWYKSHRYASTIAVKLCNSCGQVQTFNASTKCRACGSKDIRRVGSVPSYARIGKNTVSNIITHNKIHKTPQNASRDIPQKQCSKCGQLSMITNGNICTPCRKKKQKEYDAMRDKRIRRQCQKRTKDANRTARNYGLSDMLRTIDVHTLLMSCDGKSQYTGQSLANGWALEHNTPLCRGGSNTIDNIRICTPQENAIKGSMTPKQWHGWLHTQGYCQCDDMPAYSDTLL